MRRGRTKINDSQYPLFITTSIVQFIPAFNIESIAKEALQLLEEQREYHKISLYAYVLMPNHFHAICRSEQKGEVSRFVGSWKSLTANIILQTIPPDWRTKFADAARLFNEPTRKLHKVWTPRFDDLVLYDSETFVTKLKYIHQNPVKAELVKRPEDYAICALLLWVQRRTKLGDHTWLQSAFGGPAILTTQSAQGLTGTQNTSTAIQSRRNW